MKLSSDSRKWISTVVAALLVIAAVPLIVMIGCNMDMSATGGVCAHGAEILTSACSGTYVLMQHVAAAVVASGFSLTLLVLLVAFMAAAIVLGPTVQSRALVLAPATPPPPPEDPLGVRLTL